jgi:hypothetical protein
LSKKTEPYKKTNMKWLAILIFVLSTCTEIKYPDLANKEGLKQKYNNAKWFMYQTHFGAKAIPKTGLVDTIDVLECEIELFSVKTELDTTELGMFFQINNETLYNLKRGKEYFCSIGFVKKLGDEVAYRKFCAAKEFVELNEYWVNSKLLPKAYKYNQDEPCFVLEEKAFHDYIRKNKGKIRNKWLLHEAEIRGVFRKK